MRFRVAAGALAIGLTANGLAADPAPPASVGTATSALSALDPSSGEILALDPADGPIHLVFMATWCRPCLSEVPRLFDLEDRWKADGYRLFLVALPTRQTPDRLKAFLTEGPLPGRLVFDHSGAIASALGIATIPHHVLIDRAGHVVARSSAIDPPFVAALERLVRQEGRGQP